MRTWGTSLGRAGTIARIFPNYNMTRPQNAIAITFNRSARSVRTQLTDCCQFDADSLHHVLAGLSLILAVTTAAATAAASPSQAF